MKYYCNPLNVDYKYQFNQERDGSLKIAREAADPSIICFNCKYYIFASMTLGVYVSEDMAAWEFHKLPDNLPLYDYAPDVRVIGDYVYFSASKRSANCNFYRTKDILRGPYEEVPGTFPFWDPNLFMDDDGRVYFFWGCSNVTPIYGVEVNPADMSPIGETKELIGGNDKEIGYERVGEDHAAPLTEEEIEAKVQGMLAAMGMKEDNMPPEHLAMLRAYMSNNPYIEGPWLDKHNGKYYLQYACPGTQYNVYADGVYESDKPLGPYYLAFNNPYSYKPGGFMPGAGHGSTMEDKHQNLWHAATMRISINHDFERRIGIWPSGYDKDGELFCNQRYGDWPMKVEQSNMNPFADPQWYLLSYGKTAAASSSVEGKEPAKALDENVKSWWRASSSKPGEWLIVDLGKSFDVRAVHVNFADDKLEISLPEGAEFKGEPMMPRYIDKESLTTRWTLMGSLDGEKYFMIEDKSEVDTNLPHDLVVREEGIQARYLKLTIYNLPYNQPACVSGLRVFGIGDGEKPAVPDFTAKRVGDLDMDVEIQGKGALGYNILWGHAEDKLYHSYMVFETKKRIGALIKGQEYYVRVDAFNESGITEGKTVKLSTVDTF
jgi:hypothetical protein